MTIPAPDTQPEHGFARRWAAVDQFLPRERFACVVAEALALAETERSYVPAHKKGGTVAYSTIRALAPRLADLYQSEPMQCAIGRITGTTVSPTPLHDESSCSLLYYERPGDHIGWHYDHNFYCGRHYTVLLPIINQGRGQSLSSARLLIRDGGRDLEIATPPNRLVVFEGARVRHKVLPLGEGERRIIWSMTYCTDPRNSALQDIARRFKDTAFFGARALLRPAG
jgi:hypothetical protein